MADSVKDIVLGVCKVGCHNAELSVAQQGQIDALTKKVKAIEEAPAAAAADGEWI